MNIYFIESSAKVLKIICIFFYRSVRIFKKSTMYNLKFIFEFYENNWFVRFLWNLWCRYNILHQIICKKKKSSFKSRINFLIRFWFKKLPGNLNKIFYSFSEIQYTHRHILSAKRIWYLPAWCIEYVRNFFFFLKNYFSVYLLNAFNWQFS